MPLMRLLLLVAMAVLPACATVVHGSDHAMRVATDPAGATCTLLRQGSVIATLAATPGTVTIPNSRYPVILRCSAPDRGSWAMVLEPRTDRGAIAGNALMSILSGPVGAVAGTVDLATAAGELLPDQVALSYGAETRVDAMAAEIRRIAAAEAGTIRRDCVPDSRIQQNRLSCELAVQAIAHRRDRLIAMLGVAVEEPQPAPPPENNSPQAVALRRQAAASIAAIWRSCGRNDRPTCRLQANVIERERDTAIAALPPG